MASMDTRFNIEKLYANVYKSMEVQNKLGPSNLVLILKHESMKCMFKLFGLRWKFRELREIVKLRQLGKEAEKGTTWHKDGAKIMVTGVPGQEGAKDNDAERKK
ncbi:hypothetical protein Tco_0792417 [Tanacetum coccineum]